MKAQLIALIMALGIVAGCSVPANPIDRSARSGISNSDAAHFTLTSPDVIESGALPAEYT